MSVHKFLKGKGATLSHNSNVVPNGGTDKSSVKLGDAAAQKVISEANAKVSKKSNFGSFLK